MTNDIAAEGTDQGTKTPKVGRRMGEDEIRRKTDKFGQPIAFLEGTLVYVTDEVADEYPELVDKVGKQVVQKECLETGDIFWVATSDLHQCFHHPNIRRKVKAERAKELRAAKKARAEADAAELRQLRGGSDEAETSEAASA